MPWIKLLSFDIGILGFILIVCSFFDLSGFIFIIDISTIRSFIISKPVVSKSNITKGFVKFILRFFL